MAIASVLREQRESEGLSRSELARQAGRTVSTISQIESEGRGITIEALVDVCGVLGVNVSTIIRRAEKDGMD